VDKLSSAHVYCRLARGQTIDDVSEDLLTDCAQLVKANSIQGNKEKDIGIVYTMASNLKKSGDMDVGQVGFKSHKAVKRVHVEKRINEIVNRLEKTKRVDDSPNFARELEERLAIDKREAKEKLRQHKTEQKVALKQKEEDRKIRSYEGVMNSDRMMSNKGRGQELEDDFM